MKQERTPRFILLIIPEELNGERGLKPRLR